MPDKRQQPTAAEFAAAHVAESRRRLLEASECQPDELPAKVAECVDGWQEDRLAALAAGSER